jgi:Ca2+-binding EF-hand superfamily protein
MFRSALTVAISLMAVPIVAARGDDEPAATKPGGADPAAMFAELDSNKDGQLTPDEVPEERKRLFDRLVRLGDKNGDKQLTSEEFSAGLQGRSETPDEPRPDRPSREGRPGGGRFFERLDANGDGKVSPDEVPEERRDGFEKLVQRGDKDGDGALDKQELAAAFAGGGADGDRPEAPGEPGRFFERLDANKDGKVTVDEAPEQFRERIEALLKRADKDGDGAVTREEFRAAGPPDRKPPGAPGKGDDRRPDRPARDADKPDGDAAKGPRRPAGLFQVLDADGDGQLSSAELDGAADALRKLDADGDGTVAIAEVVKLQPMRKKGNK